MRTRWTLLLLGLALAALPRLSPAAARIQFQDIVVKPGDTLWSVSETWLKDPKDWDKILKHNKQLTADPTVALPGMTLKIPIGLIKEEQRAAKLVYKSKKVLFRRKETVKWKSATKNMQLYRNDTLRTLKGATARVQFLNSNLLSLNPNSMAVIKPTDKNYDIVLKQGGVFAGNSTVLTPGAKIIPRDKNTKFTATVRADQSTVVEVYEGVADVVAGGKTQEVFAGMAVEVGLGMVPSVPVNIPEISDFESRSEQYRAVMRSLKADKALKFKAAPKATALTNIVPEVGEAVSGYHIQLSRTRNFAKPLVDKVFDVDNRIKIDELGLPAGRYWGRVAVIDLLGIKGKFSAPKLYTVGQK